MNNRILTTLPLLLSWEISSSIMLQESYMVVAAFSPSASSVFCTTTKAAAARPNQALKTASAMRMNVDNNADDKLANTNQQQRQQRQWKKRLALKNFGGRASRGRKEAATPSMISKNKNDTASRGGSNALWKLLAPLAGLVLILRLLFGGGGGSGKSNFYYYQSSSYESSVVTGDGRVDTARKKSIRSNIPGLIIEKSGSDDGRRASSSSSSSSSIRLLEQERVPSADFDDALDREIEYIFRQERRMMDDFFY
jgi:hypothetical protein